MNESSDDSSDDGVNVNITRGENSQHGRASRQNAMDSESFDDHVKTLRSKNERTSSNESEYGSVYVRRQLCKRKINDFDSKTSSASGTKDFDDKTSLASKDDVSLPNKIFKLSNQFLTESLRRISEICVLMQKYMSFLGNMKNIGDWLSKYNNKFKQLIGKEVNSDEENRMETESLNECSVEGNKDDGEVQQNLETDLEDENKSEGKNNKKVKKEKKLNKDDSLNEEEKIVEMTNENVNNKKQNEVDEKLSTMDQLCDKGYGSGESKANDEPMDEDTDNENCISLLEHQFSDSSNSSSRKPSIKFDNLIFTPDGTHENLPTDDEEQINKNKPQSSNKSSMNLDNDIVYYLDKSGKLRQHIEDNINQKKSVTKAIFSSQEQNIRSSSCEIVSVVENVSDSGEKFLNQWNKVSIPLC